MTANMIEIWIAKDFSRFPAGRFRSDGPFSGEAFREDHLVPAFTHSKPVTIHLDGVEGYPSSFLDEAFGGLVRKEKLSIAMLRKHLTLLTADPAYEEEIWDYIERSAE